MKGSMTVEAALIFPFSLLVILILCYLGIYQYDCGVIKVTGYECILQMKGDSWKIDSHFEEELQKKFMENARERCIGTMELDVSVKITESKIQLHSQGIHGKLHLPIDISVIYQWCHPEKTLRMKKYLTGGSDD